MSSELEPSSPFYETVTRQHYRDSKVAAEYDRRLSKSVVDRLITRLETRAVARSLSRIHAAPGDLILDVPSGTGKLMPLLDGLALSAVSLDISPEMMAHSTVLRPVLGDVESLPFRTDAFDHSVSLRLFHRVPEDVMERGVLELCRVSRRGVIVFYAAEPWLDGIRRRLKKLLGRQQTPWTMLTPSTVGLMLPEAWHVVSDEPLAPAYLVGRVAVAVPLSST